MSLIAWKKWAWVPLLFLAGFIAWIIFRGRRSPFSAAKAELRAIDAEREVLLIQEENGKEKALQYVKERYLLSLLSLKDKSRERVKELENDPPRLAAHLRRLISRRDLEQ
jgi:hypothetical protein